MATKTLDTIDVIKAIVNTMTPTVAIQNAIENLDGTYTLDIFDTYWLKRLDQVTIDSKDYKIISFTINESITIQDITTGAGLPIVSSFVLPKPYFVHGTPIRSAQAQAAPKVPKDRLPFIWCFEVLKEKAIDDRGSVWGRSSSPKLYFMDSADSENWGAEEHKKEVGEPMRQMVEYFFKQINDEPGLYDEVKEHEEIALSDWGSLIQSKGFVARIFNEPLTGHEVGFEFKMSKTACDPRQGIHETECTLVLESVDATDETSVGANDGTAIAVINIVPQLVTFSWAGPNGFISDQQFIENLEPGLYVVTVSEIANEECFDTGSVTVNAEAAELLAADFNGSNYLSSTNPLFDKSTSSFAFSGWFWVDSTVFSQVMLSKWQPIGSEKSYLLQYNLGSTMRFLASHNGSTNTIVTSSVTITVNTWHFVSAFYSSVTNEIGICVDGESAVMTALPAGGVFNSSAEFNVGQFDGGFQGLNGREDSVSVWSKEWTQTDHDNGYNSGDGQTYPDMSKVGLDAHYKMNELTGARLDFVSSFDLTDSNSVGRAEGKILD